MSVRLPGASPGHPSMNKDPAACPYCGKQAVMRCRCPRADCVCPDGHVWHTCTVHGVKVMRAGSHTWSTDRCTCSLRNASPDNPYRPYVTK